ncbi:hypothetical protein HG530_001393 [Fusarium avenaceum]|nr:hypothetical protein HG530_001393 [Fusarium avenaceum]
MTSRASSDRKRHSRSSRQSVPLSPRNNGQRNELREISKETLKVLPSLINELGTGDLARQSFKHSIDSLNRLDPHQCPSYRQPAIIKVVNNDTLNAAIELSHRTRPDGEGVNAQPPIVVNFANRHSPGGGWMNGAMAQEEALCYRSSLALSLNKKHYPLERDQALYSPYVLIMREDIPSGHRLSSLRARELPVVSVLTIAALRNPRVRVFRNVPYTNQSYQSNSVVYDKHVFAHDRDRNLTKAKMRLSLRMAANNKHDTLVLGALGCGVYGNPPEDVANCWLEVLREDEFSGNWWREVWFAIFDPKNEGNFGIFHYVLDGRVV